MFSKKGKAWRSTNYGWWSWNDDGDKIGSPSIDKEDGGLNSIDQLIVNVAAIVNPRMRRLLLRVGWWWGDAEDDKIDIDGNH